MLGSFTLLKSCFLVADVLFRSLADALLDSFALFDCFVADTRAVDDDGPFVLTLKPIWPVLLDEMIAETRSKPE